MTSRHAAERVSFFPHFSDFHLTKLFCKVTHPNRMVYVYSTVSYLLPEHPTLSTTVESEINFRSTCRRKGFIFSAFLGVLYNEIIL